MTNANVREDPIRIKVLVAEDIEPIRRHYAEILSKDPSIDVVAQVGNGYEAVLRTALLRPDVILMDIEMEEKDAGLRATREILKQFPETRIIVLTVYKEDELVFSAFQMGVCDYLVKDSKALDIIKCVKDAHLGQSPIRSEIASMIRTEFRRVKSYESSFRELLELLIRLTPTEIDILCLLARGMGRKEICEYRHVEMTTLKTHVHSVLKKLGKDSIQGVLDTLNDLELFPALAKTLERRENEKT